MICPVVYHLHNFVLSRIILVQASTFRAMKPPCASSAAHMLVIHVLAFGASLVNSQSTSAKCVVLWQQRALRVSVEGVLFTIVVHDWVFFG